MSIINSNETIADAFRRVNTEAYQTILSQYVRVYSYFWRHPTSTPEQIAAALGPDAGAYIANAYALYFFLDSIAPVNLPALQQITINPDGTVTLTPLPEPAGGGQ